MEQRMYSSLLSDVVSTAADLLDRRPYTRRHSRPSRSMERQRAVGRVWPPQSYMYLYVATPVYQQHPHVGTAKPNADSSSGKQAIERTFMNHGALGNTSDGQKKMEAGVLPSSGARR